MMLGDYIDEENKENIWVADSHKSVKKSPVKTRPKRKPLTIAVEGNIGSGKSTFLQHFAKYPEVKVIPEPVPLWKNISGHNLLELMYQDPQRWSYAFQSYVQLTMLKVHSKELSKKHKVKFMERSMFSARYCFLENLYESGKIDPVHSAILDEWFKWMKENTDLSLDLIVYLKASPQTCHNRIHERQRSEESGVPLSYLETLHRLHEDWLIHQKTFKIPAPVLVLDAEKDVSTLVKTFESKQDGLFDGFW